MTVFFLLQRICRNSVRKTEEPEMKLWPKLFISLFNCLLVGGALFFFVTHEKELSSLMNFLFVSVSGLCLLINLSYFLYTCGLLFFRLKRKTGHKNYFNTETIQRQLPLEKTLPANK